MYSMTGYSKLNFENLEFKLKIEMKSVNNKYLNLNIKHPSFLNFLDHEIKKLASKYISRGYVELKMDFYDNRESDDVFELDQNIVKGYLKVLDNLEKEADSNFSNKLDVLVRYPNIMRRSDQDKGEEEAKELILEKLKEAFSSLNNMREKEGDHIKEFFLKQIKHLEEIIEKIKKFIPEVKKNYQEKMLARINNNSSNIEIKEKDILQEFLIFLDRSDVSEEISRFESHIKQFVAELDKKIVGKKLDFMIQEMMRELNTLGVKSNFYEISKSVVEGKVELEKIREQVQNIE